MASGTQDKIENVTFLTHPERMHKVYTHLIPVMFKLKYKKTALCAPISFFLH